MNSRHTNDEQHVNNIPEDNVCKGKSNTKNINFDSLPNVPYNERVTVLASAWQAATEPIASSTLLHNLHRITLLYILQEEWSKLDSSKKDELRSKVECCSAALESVGNQGGFRRLKYLLEVSHEPWKHPVLKDIMEGRTPSKENVEQWCKDEGVAGGLERLRQLCVAGSACVGAALRMARALLTLENTHGARKTALDTMLVLLFKKGDTATCISEIKALDSKEVISVIGRLSVKDKSSGRLWKHAHDTAVLCAQLTVAGCLVKPLQESELYTLAGQLASLYTQHPDRLPAVLRKLLQPADSALHIYTVCRAVQHQFADTMRPFICELYIRALTTAMNELERQKLQDENSDAVKSTSHTLARWFVNLADYLASNKSVSAECILTAFSLHPSKQYYNRVQECSEWMCKKDAKSSTDADVKEATDGIVRLGLDGDVAKEGNSETDSKDTKAIPLFSDGIGVDGKGLAQRLVSGEVLDAEGLGLTADACNDLAVLISGPRLKMLTWELTWEDLSGHCLSYMEDTAEGTKAVTKELKFVRLDFSQFEYQEPEVHDIYFGIEKGYEHHLEIEEDEDDEEDYWENEPPRRQYRRTSTESDSDQSDSRTSTKKSVKQKKKPIKVTEGETVKKEIKKEKKKPDQNTKIKCKVKKKKEGAADSEKEKKRLMNTGVPVNIKVKPFDESAPKFDHPPASSSKSSGVRSLDLSNMEDMKILLSTAKKTQPPASASSLKSKSLINRIAVSQPASSPKDLIITKTQPKTAPIQNSQTVRPVQTAPHTSHVTHRPSPSFPTSKSVSLYRQQMDRYEAWKNMQFEKEFSHPVPAVKTEQENVKPAASQKTDNKHDFQSTLSNFIAGIKTQPSYAGNLSVGNDERNCSGIVVKDERNFSGIVVKDERNCSGIVVKDERNCSGIVVKDERNCSGIVNNERNLVKQDATESQPKQDATESQPKQDATESQPVWKKLDVDSDSSRFKAFLKFNTLALEEKEKIRKLEAAEEKKKRAAEKRRQAAQEKKKKAEREKLEAVERAALEYAQKKQQSDSLLQDALDEISSALLPGHQMKHHDSVAPKTSVIVKNQHNVAPPVASYKPTDLSPNRSVSSVPISYSSASTTPKPFTKPTKILDFSQSRVMEYEYVSPLKISPEVLRDTSDRRNTTTISHPSNSNAANMCMYNTKLKIENFNEYSQFSHASNNFYATSQDQSVSNLSTVAHRKTSSNKVPKDGKFTQKKAEELPPLNIKIANPYGIPMEHNNPTNAAKSNVKREQTSMSETIDNPYGKLKMLSQVSIHKMTKDVSGSVRVEKDPYVHPSVGVPPASMNSSVSPTKHAAVTKDMMSELKQKEILINNAMSVLKNKTMPSNSSFQMFLNEMHTMVNAGLDNSNKPSNDQLAIGNPDLYCQTQPVQSYQQQLLAKKSLTPTAQDKTSKVTVERKSVFQYADVPIMNRKETAPQTYARKNYSSQMKKQSLTVPAQSNTAPIGQVSSSDNSVILRMPQPAFSNSLMTQKSANQIEANLTNACTNSQPVANSDSKSSKTSRNRLEMLKNPIKVSVAGLSENEDISKLLVPSPKTPRNFKDPTKAASVKRKQTTPKHVKNEIQNVCEQSNSDTWTPLEWGLRHVKNLDAMTNISQPAPTPLPSFSTFSTKSDGTTNRICNIVPMMFPSNNLYSASIGDSNKAQIQVAITQPSTVVSGSSPNTYKTDTIVSTNNRKDSTNHISINTNSNNNVSVKNLLQYRKPKTHLELQPPRSQQSKPIQEQRNDYKDFSDILDVIEQDLQMSLHSTNDTDKPMDASTVSTKQLNVSVPPASAKQQTNEDWKTVEKLFEAIDSFDWQPRLDSNASQINVAEKSLNSVRRGVVAQISSKNVHGATSPIKDTTDLSNEILNDMLQNTKNSACNDLPQLPDNILKDLCDVLEPNLKLQSSLSLSGSHDKQHDNTITCSSVRSEDSVVLNAFEQYAMSSEVNTSMSGSSAMDLLPNSENVDENRNRNTTVYKKCVVTDKETFGSKPKKSIDCEKSGRTSYITVNASSSVDGYIQLGDVYVETLAKSPDVPVSKTLDKTLDVPISKIPNECMSRTLDDSVSMTLNDPKSITHNKTLDNPVLRTLDKTPDETVSKTLEKILDVPMLKILNDSISKSLDDSVSMTLSDPKLITHIKTVDNPVSRTLDKTPDDTMSKTLDNPVLKTLDKTPDETVSKTLDDPVTMTLDDLVSKTLDYTLSKTLDKTLVNPVSKTTDEPVLKTPEDTVVEVLDEASSKTCDDIASKNTEISTPENTDCAISDTCENSVSKTLDDTVTEDVLLKTPDESVSETCHNVATKSLDTVLSETCDNVAIKSLDTVLSETCDNVATKICQDTVTATADIASETPDGAQEENIPQVDVLSDSDIDADAIVEQTCQDEIPNVESTDLVDVPENPSDASDPNVPDTAKSDATITAEDGKETATEKSVLTHVISSTAEILPETAPSVGNTVEVTTSGDNAQEIPIVDLTEPGFEISSTAVMLPNVQNKNRESVLRKSKVVSSIATLLPDANLLTAPKTLGNVVIKPVAIKPPSVVQARPVIVTKPGTNKSTTSVFVRLPVKIQNEIPAGTTVVSNSAGGVTKIIALKKVQPPIETHGRVVNITKFVSLVPQPPQVNISVAQVQSQSQMLQKETKADEVIDLLSSDDEEKVPVICTKPRKPIPQPPSFIAMIDIPRNLSAKVGRGRKKKSKGDPYMVIAEGIGLTKVSAIPNADLEKLKLNCNVGLLNNDFSALESISKENAKVKPPKKVTKSVKRKSCDIESTLQDIQNLSFEYKEVMSKVAIATPPPNKRRCSARTQNPNTDKELKTLLTRKTKLDVNSNKQDSAPAAAVDENISEVICLSEDSEKEDDSCIDKVSKEKETQEPKTRTTIIDGNFVVESVDETVPETSDEQTVDSAVELAEKESLIDNAVQDSSSDKVTKDSVPSEMPPPEQNDKVGVISSEAIEYIEIDDDSETECNPSDASMVSINEAETQTHEASFEAVDSAQNAVDVTVDNVDNTAEGCTDTSEVLMDIKVEDDDSEDPSNVIVKNPTPTSITDEIPSETSNSAESNVKETSNSNLLNSELDKTKSSGDENMDVENQTEDDKEIDDKVEEVNIELPTVPAISEDASRNVTEENIAEVAVKDLEIASGVKESSDSNVFDIELDDKTKLPSDENMDVENRTQVELPADDAGQLDTELPAVPAISEDANQNIPEEMTGEVTVKDLEIASDVKRTLDSNVSELDKTKSPGNEGMEVENQAEAQLSTDDAVELIEAVPAVSEDASQNVSEEKISEVATKDSSDSEEITGDAELPALPAISEDACQNIIEEKTATLCEEIALGVQESSDSNVLNSEFDKTKSSGDENMDVQNQTEPQMPINDEVKAVNTELPTILANSKDTNLTEDHLSTDDAVEQVEDTVLPAVPAISEVASQNVAEEKTLDVVATEDFIVLGVEETEGVSVLNGEPDEMKLSGDENVDVEIHTEAQLPADKAVENTELPTVPGTSEDASQNATEEKIETSSEEIESSDYVALNSETNKTKSPVDQNMDVENQIEVQMPADDAVEQIEDSKLPAEPIISKDISQNVSEDNIAEVTLKDSSDPEDIELPAVPAISESASQIVTDEKTGTICDEITSSVKDSESETTKSPCDENMDIENQAEAQLSTDDAGELIEGTELPAVSKDASQNVIEEKTATICDEIASVVNEMSDSNVLNNELDKTELLSDENMDVESETEEQTPVDDKIEAANSGLPVVSVISEVTSLNVSEEKTAEDSIVLGIKETSDSNVFDIERDNKTKLPSDENMDVENQTQVQSPADDAVELDNELPAVPAILEDASQNVPEEKTAELAIKDSEISIENMDVENQTETQLPIDKAVELIDDTELLAVPAISEDASQNVAQLPVELIDDTEAVPAISEDASQNTTEDKTGTSCDEGVKEAADSNVLNSELDDKTLSSGDENMDVEIHTEAQLPVDDAIELVEDTELPAVPAISEDTSQSVAEEKTGAICDKIASVVNESSDSNVLNNELENEGDENMDIKIPTELIEDFELRAVPAIAEDENLTEEQTLIAEEVSELPAVPTNSKDVNESTTEEKPAEVIDNSIEDSAISNRADDAENASGVEKAVIQNDTAVLNEVRIEPESIHILQVVDKIAKHVAEKIGRKYSKPVVRLERLATPVTIKRKRVAKNSAIAKTKDVIDPGIPKQRILRSRAFGKDRGVVENLIDHPHTSATHDVKKGILDLFSCGNEMEKLSRKNVDHSDVQGSKEIAESELQTVVKDSQTVVSKGCCLVISKSHIDLSENSEKTQSADHDPQTPVTDDVKMDIQDLFSCDNEMEKSPRQITDIDSIDRSDGEGSKEIAKSMIVEDSHTVVSEGCCLVILKSRFSKNSEQLQSADPIEDSSPRIDEKTAADANEKDLNVSIKNAKRTIENIDSVKRAVENLQTPNSEIAKESNDLSLPVVEPKDVVDTATAHKVLRICLTDIKHLYPLPIIGKDLRCPSVKITKEFIDLLEAGSKGRETAKKSAKKHSFDAIGSNPGDSKAKDKKVILINDKLGVKELGKQNEVSEKFGDANTSEIQNKDADKNFHDASISQSQDHELARTEIGKVCGTERVTESEREISKSNPDPNCDDEICKLIVKVDCIAENISDDDDVPLSILACSTPTKEIEGNCNKVENKLDILTKNAIDFNKFEEIMLNPDDCNVSDHSTDESLEYISFGSDKSTKKDLDSSGEIDYKVVLKNPVKTYVNPRVPKRKVSTSKDTKASKPKVGKINLPVSTTKENTTIMNDNVYESLTVKEVMKLDSMEYENLDSVEDFTNEDMEIASIEGASEDVKTFLSDFNTLEELSDPGDPRGSFYSPIFTDDDNILNKVMEEDEFIVNNLDVEEFKHRSEIRNRKLLTIERRRKNVSKYDREGFGFRSDRDVSSDLLDGRHEGPAALSDFPNPRLPKTLRVNENQSQGDNGNSHVRKTRECIIMQANLENYYNTNTAMVLKRVGQSARDYKVTPLSEENIIKQLKELIETKETPVRKVYKNNNKAKLEREYVKNTLARVPGMSDLDHIRIPPPSVLINVVQVGQLPVSSAQQITLPGTPTRSNSTNEYLEVASNNSSEYRGDEQSGSQDNDSQVIKEVSSEESTPPEQQTHNQDENSIVECPAVTETNDSTPANSESQKVQTSESQPPPTVLQVTSAQETITLNPATTSTSNSIAVSNSPLDGQVQLIFAPQSMIQQNFIASDNQEHKDGENNTESSVTNIIQGTSTTTTTTTYNPVSRAQTLVNILSQKIIRPPVSGVNTSQVQMATFPKGTPINALSLQQALAQILPPPLSQSSGDGSQNVGHPTGPQVVHIVQGKAAGQPGGTFSGLLMDNSQQSVVSVSGGTQVLHIVQGKNTMAGSNVLGQSQLSGTTFGGLSLVDAGSQQGGNQVLHIVNTGAQSKNSTATAQLLKRVNLLTSLTNAQGNEQKMVQFVCKSADGKSIQLNAQPQRGMVLRLQPIETPTSISQQKPVENLVTTANTTIIQQVPKKSPTSAEQSQEIKSRSIYEENYAKFIQNSKLSPITTEKSSVTLPKFNQAFGKSIYQESVTKSDSETNQNQSSASEQQPQELPNTIGITQMGQLSNPPLLIRKTQQPGTTQNIVGQVKQGVTPMNIQTMHGGVIYTRQIPVNIGGGQTINLITVPSTELIDEAHLQAIQKQVQEKNSEQQQSQQIEQQQMIKLVPQQDQNQQNVTLHVDTSSDDANQSFADQQQSNINTHPLLAQMRIKVPMLSKGGTQMVTGTRVVRPVLQIQRNIIPGTNPQVYQQLVLTTAPALRPPTPAPTVRPQRPPTATPQQESSLSSSTLEQLREFDMVLEQVKERSTVQPGSNSNSTYSESSPRQNIDSEVSVVQTSQPVVTQTPQREVLYSIGPNHTVNVTYVNKNVLSGNPTVLTTFPQNQETTTIVNMGQQNSPQIQIGHGLINTINSASKPTTPTKASSKTMKPKSSKPPTVTPSSSKASPVAPKTSVQKPLEDEQTTQRILYILAEYKEQVENSPDKDKPAPRRRSNPPTNPSTSSKRKKGSGGSSKKGSNGQSMQEMSPSGDDTGHTMGSEDSSCGLSQGECADNSIPGPESQSPQGSPQKAARKLVFPPEQEISNPPVTQPQRNVIIADGQTIAMTRPGPGGKATAVLMPANYLLPMSMMKGGQQITIVTNQGPKILNVPQGEGGATNTLFLQRLISPAGLKPMLARPGQVRQVRLPANAVQNLQAFNLTTAQNISGQEGSWISGQQVINNQQPKLVVEYSPNVNVNHDLNPDSVKSEASDAHSLKEENMSVSGGSEIATPRHSEASSDELSSKNRSSDEGIYSGQTDSATDDSVQSTLHSRNDQILHHIQMTKAPTNATVNLIQVHSLNPNEPGKIYSVQNPASLGSLIRLAGKTSLGQTFQTINVQGVNQDLTKVSPDVQECAQNLLLVRKHFDGQYTLTTAGAADSGLRDVEMKNANLNQLQQDLQVDASPSPGSQQSYGLGHSDQMDDNLPKVDTDGTVSWSLSSNGGRSVVHGGGDDTSPSYVYSADSPSGLVQQAEQADVSLRESEHDRRVLRHEYSPDGGSPAPSTPRHLYHKMFISSPDKGDHTVQDHLKKDDHSQSSTITLHSSNSPSFTIHHHHGSHQLTSGGPSSSGSGGSNTHHHNHHHQAGSGSTSGQHSSGQSHHHPARLGGDTRTPHHVLRHKYALMEHELRLQKSLSEECEDLGVDSPSASDLFPEADLLFANSPSSQFDHSQDGQMSSAVAGNPNTSGGASNIGSANLNNSGSVSTLSTIHGAPVSVTALGLREENLGPVEEEFARMHPNTTFHSGEIDILEDQDDMTTFRGTKRSAIRTTAGRRNEVVRSVIEGVGSSGMPTIYQPNKLTTHFSLVGMPKRSSINIMSLQSSDDNSEGADDSMNSAESKDGLVNNKHLDGMLNSNITRDVNLSASDSPGCISSNIIQRNVAQVIRHASDEQMLSGKDSGSKLCGDENSPGPQNGRSFLLENSSDVRQGDSMILKTLMMERDGRDGLTCSSPEQHSELFWESNSNSNQSDEHMTHGGTNLLDFSSEDSNKCCKSPPSCEETNSTDSSSMGGMHVASDKPLRLNSVIKSSGSTSTAADGPILHSALTSSIAPVVQDSRKLDLNLHKSDSNTSTSPDAEAMDTSARRSWGRGLKSSGVRRVLSPRSLSTEINMGAEIETSSSEGVNVLTKNVTAVIHSGSSTPEDSAVVGRRASLRGSNHTKRSCHCCPPPSPPPHSANTSSSSVSGQTLASSAGHSNATGTSGHGSIVTPARGRNRRRQHPT